MSTLEINVSSALEVEDGVHVCTLASTLNPEAVLSLTLSQLRFGKVGKIQGLHPRARDVRVMLMSGDAGWTRREWHSHTVEGRAGPLPGRRSSYYSSLSQKHSSLKVFS